MLRIVNEIDVLYGGSVGLYTVLRIPVLFSLILSKKYSKLVVDKNSILTALKSNIWKKGDLMVAGAL
tara:strand:- start:179 stop:379 length:201 start_codon:yes stop_codon:yes gene_type:complete